IRFAQQLRDRLSRGCRLDDCTVADVGSREANTRELSRCFDLRTFDRYAKTLSFAIEVIAVACCQREHKKLTAIDRRATACCLRRDGEGLGGRASANGYLEVAAQTRDRGSDLHGGLRHCDLRCLTFEFTRVRRL